MTERLNCFPPIAEPDAKILILGSFPGEASLAKQQYYGNPRNSFWPIMAHLFAFENTMHYRFKVNRLTSNRIAPRDPAYICFTSGSTGTPNGVLEETATYPVRAVLTQPRGNPLDDLQAALTERTKVVVVNLPHNPTGFQPTRAEFERGGDGVGFGEIDPGG